MDKNIPKRIINYEALDNIVINSRKYLNSGRKIDSNRFSMFKVYFP
jgi:hypothetical protein